MDMFSHLPGVVMLERYPSDRKEALLHVLKINEDSKYALKHIEVPYNYLWNLCIVGKHKLAGILKSFLCSSRGTVVHTLQIIL